MDHLSPYSAPRFREADRQEMASLMSADEPARIPATKVQAVMRALAEGFPDYDMSLREFEILIPHLSVEILCEENQPGIAINSTTRLRRHDKAKSGEGWVCADRLSDKPAHNLLIEFTECYGKQNYEFALDVIASFDDFFYAKNIVLVREGGSSPKSYLHKYYVCDGMRGLLDLIGSLGRKDI